MRRKVFLFFVVNIFVVAILVHSFWPLITLLFLRGDADRISPHEIPSADSDAIDPRPQRIPKIIHQTYITNGMPSPTNGTYTDQPIPEVWREAQQSCITIHDDYEYKLWTDSNSRNFIEAEYSWFLKTWDSYIFPIERADAIRYFALYHYGGIYIDLDNGCQRRLDPLLTYSAWVRQSTPTGIGNDVLGTVPGHPFFTKLIESLDQYNRNWISPYVTIMGSTGPLYASLIWRSYNLEEHYGKDRVRILFKDEYMSKKWSFFVHHVGNSWHKWDAETIFWMNRHWMGLTTTGFIVAGFVFAAMWWATHRVTFINNSGRAAGNCFGRIQFWRRHKRKDYIELTQHIDV